jgi:hypothetical protein
MIVVAVAAATASSEVETAVEANLEVATVAVVTLEVVAEAVEISATVVVVNSAAETANTAKQRTENVVIAVRGKVGIGEDVEAVANDANTITIAVAVTTSGVVTINGAPIKITKEADESESSCHGVFAYVHLNLHDYLRQSC